MAFLPHISIINNAYVHTSVCILRFLGRDIWSVSEAQLKTKGGEGIYTQGPEVLEQSTVPGEVRFIKSVFPF